MKVYFKKRTVEIPIHQVSELGKISGLMFRRKTHPNLLFQFKNSRPLIHSFFVFFPFLALWMDQEDKVVDSQIVHPFTLQASPKYPATKLIELPINEKNRQILKIFVDKGKV